MNISDIQEKSKGFDLTITDLILGEKETQKKTLIGLLTKPYVNSDEMAVRMHVKHNRSTLASSRKHDPIWFTKPMSIQEVVRRRSDFECGKTDEWLFTFQVTHLPLNISKSVQKLDVVVSINVQGVITIHSLQYLTETFSGDIKETCTINAKMDKCYEIQKKSKLIR
jgi:hypothetical protein